MLISRVLFEHLPEGGTQMNFHARHSALFISALYRLQNVPGILECSEISCVVFTQVFLTTLDSVFNQRPANLLRQRIMSLSATGIVEVPVALVQMLPVEWISGGLFVYD